MRDSNHPTLCVRLPSGKYRPATRNEVLEAASQYLAAMAPFGGTPIRSPFDTESYLRTVYAGLEREKFGITFLDQRHRVLAFEFMFPGTIDGTLVYPRELVKRALEHNAAAIIVSHNHPSGDPEPSGSDREITRQIKAALELVGIRLLDHFVIGRDCSVSFASQGWLDEEEPTSRGPMVIR